MEKNKRQLHMTFIDLENLMTGFHDKVWECMRKKGVCAVDICKIRERYL